MNVTFPDWYDPALFYDNGVLKASTDFVHEASAWPMVHVLMSFTTYMAFQNVWLTIAIFYIWETSERFQLLICNDHYCIFSSDEIVENINDSLFGDIIQGFVGLLLARMLMVAFAVPFWNFGLYTSVARGIMRLWFKRVLMLLLFLFAFFKVNLVQYFDTVEQEWKTFSADSVPTELSELRRIGVLISWFLYSIVLAIFFFWNFTKKERRTFWMLRGNLLFHVYLRFFVAWWFVISLLYLSVSHSFFNSDIHMVQTWIAAGAIAFFFILISMLAYGYNRRKQAHRMLDVLTFGIYSLCCARNLSYHHNFYGTEDWKNISTVTGK